MNFFEEIDGKTLLVKPDFPIEVENVDIVFEMKEKILNWIHNQDKPTAIFNLEHCEFIDSIGLGNLIVIYEHIRRRKGKFLFCNVNKDIESLFNLSGFNDFIFSYKSLEDALQERDN